MITKLGALRSPIGLAAGYDKTGRYLDALAKLGFGYVVAGTFTLNRRIGHPRPRVAYRPKDLAVVNAMGMPNPGLREAMRWLKRPRSNCRLVISLTGSTLDEIAECYRLASTVADGIEVNISSPNFPSDGRLQERDFMSRLCGKLKPLRSKPTYLKIPPTKSEKEEELIVDLVSGWVDAGFEGVTAVNALPIEAPELAVGRGGLSGAPLRRYMKSTVELLRRELGGGFELNAVGGIMSGLDAAEALKAGATTVQIYTAILYRGYRAPVLIAEEMKGLLTREVLSAVHNP